MAIKKAVANQCLKLFSVLMVATIGHAQGSMEQTLGQQDILDPGTSWQAERSEVIALFIKTPVATTLVNPENPIYFDTAAEQSVAEQIRKLIADRQFDKALEAVEALETKQPRDFSVFNLRGAVYLAKGDFANARMSYEQALALKPNSTVAAMNLAELDLRDNNPDAARRRFQAIVAIDQTNAEAMIGLAGVAAATAKEAEYVSWLEKATKAAPRMVRPRVLLASYYLQKGEMQKALAAAKEAQSLITDNPQILDILGAAQLAAGETDNAIASFGTLVRLDPKNPAAQYELASAQITARNMRAARESLNKALALQPDYLPAEVLLATVELDARQYGEALKRARQIQARHPGSASGLALQGDVFMAQSRFAPALQVYEKGFAINKTGLLAIKVHQALSAGGNPKEADVRLLRWLQDQPNDQASRSYLAASFIKRKLPKQAIEQYQRLLEINPKNARALNDLAWLYQGEKDPRALSTAEQAYQLKPDNAEVMDTLGWILAERGDTARALTLLRAAADKAPMSTEIQFHWAATLAKSGDKAQARKALESLLTKNKDFAKRQEAQAMLKQL